MNKDMLESVRALAITALCRGTDVSPGAILSITDSTPAERRQVDPPGCGCTECITGECRTAVDWDDFLHSMGLTAFKEAYGSGWEAYITQQGD